MCGVITSVDQRSTHGVHREIVEFNIVIGVVLGEQHVLLRMLRVELLHETVEQFNRLAVVQLQSPIHHSLWSNRDRVVMRSWVMVEETCIISHLRLAQSSTSQLSEFNKLEVFPEG